MKKIKIKKDDILYSKFQKKYRAIFKDDKFIEFTRKHFNSNGGFAGFILAFLENQVGSKKALEHVTINAHDWIDIFYDLYTDENIIVEFNNLVLNPIIEYNMIVKSFDAFDPIISKFIRYFERENLDFKLPNEQIRRIIKTAFSYILYNCLDCKLPYQIGDLLTDVQYDQKVIIVLNNTRFFSDAKKAILDNCGKKINDLITMLLAVSKNLYYDKD